ncbi:MAG: hypothetical protein C0418_06580 [Coriobacteriaceae bacterium]|nr:hypothetical protein [Coriobacteriaceae bacterium]
MASPEIAVDTSVAHKWFSSDNEADVEEALRLLSAHRNGDVRLLAPASLPLELMNDFRYSNLDTTDVLLVGRWLFALGIELTALDEPLLESATTMARGLGVTVYDAVFLALALDRGCPLVTADRRAWSRMHEAGDVRLLGVDPLPL